MNASVVYWNRNGLNGSSQAMLDSGAVGRVRVDDTAIHYFRDGALVRRFKP